MRNFTYNNIQEITICTALPSPKANEVQGQKSIALYEQTTSDLGFLAAQNIMQSKSIDPNAIGALIFMSKTPDYRGPATAMVLQNRLQIPEDCIVYDSPTGNGGFESAINLGSALLSSVHKEYALVIFGDTISKQLSEVDMEQLDFQDGATAVLLQKGETDFPVSMSTTTLSKAWSSFMVPSGGFRNEDRFFENLESKRTHQQAEHLHLDVSKMAIALRPELTAIKNKMSELITKAYTSNFAILINLLEPELERELALLFPSDAYSKRIYLSSNYFPQTMAATIPLIMELVASENRQQLPFQVISVSLGEGLSINIGSVIVNEATVLKSISSDVYYENGFVTHNM